VRRNSVMSLKKYQVTLAERHKEPKVYSISAKDEDEAREWGEKNILSLKLEAKVMVSPEGILEI